FGFFSHRFSPDPVIEERAKSMFSLLLQRVREPLQANVPRPGPLRMSAADSVKTAILCNDSTYSSEDLWQQKETESLTKYPVAGSALEARQCTTWPRNHSKGLPHKELARLDSLLMVQAEFDDHTPSTGAAWAFERTFPASRVQLKNAYAHGVSFSGVSACVNQWVGDYLVHGNKPPRSTVCTDATVQ
ncbi:alpha/beta hydrolase, partial [Pseudomonas sp. TNT11]